jgi:type I restriction enzyme S subunit
MKTVKKIPALRFSGFDDDWKEYEFGKVYTFFQTNSFSRALLNYEDGVVKNIHYGDIHSKFATNFDVKHENVPYINIDEDLSRISNECYCQERDLVIADASEDYQDVGKTIEIINTQNQKILAGLHTYLARDLKSQMAKGFMGSLLKTWSARHQIMRMATGISVLGISKGNFSKIEFFAPTEPEQKKIASFLWAMDEKIEQLTKKKNLLEAYKKGVTQKIFKQDIRFKDDNDKPFPDWETKPLGGITDRVAEKNTDDAINHVLTNSAKKGVVSQQDYFDKDIANQDNLQGYYVVKKDDFVYNPRVSSTAKVGPIKRNHLSTGVMSPLYSVFRFTEGSLDFYEHYFETSFWHKYLYSVANIGARHDRMNITTSDFQKMPMPFPHPDEQKKIAGLLSALGQKIELVDAEIEYAKAFKKGLLQQMFV